MAKEKRLIDAIVNTPSKAARSCGDDVLTALADRQHEILDLVEKALAIATERAKHGRWEPHPRHPGFDRCSFCQDCIIANDWGDGEKWRYCPHCGARMDGDGDG